MGLHREYHRIADHPQVAQQARSQPGTWVRLGTYRNAETARQTAYSVRNGKLPSYAPRGSFQTWRSLDDGQRTVWVRYTDGQALAANLPGEMPAPVRLVAEAHYAAALYLSGGQAADLLAAHGYTDEAAQVRALVAAHRKTGALQVAAHLLQTSAARKDSAQ
ncbi:hypothetical protein ACIP2X_18650 [Streptomyces sp. NPDC089424]|uniref:hypothetical protein n=1 Tax=Streptomyces sp. NPDC089424 TaxID=3365917 RepID=UPI00381A1F1D